MIVAVIPAAGHSARMGRPKLSLPLGDKSVLERTIDALRGGGVENVLVVVGPHVRELVPLARAAGAEVCPLAEATPDMRATVEHGWRWFEERHPMRADDWWFLVPADHPCLEPSVVRELLAASASHRDQSVFIPTYEGRRGHPALVGWKHVAGMRELPAGVGLNVYLRPHFAETMEVDALSPGVLLDLDTPEDYQRLLNRFGPTHV